MEFIQSEKGKPMYIDGNYIFWSDGFSKVDDQLLFWRCSKRLNGCKARLHTINGEVIKRINDHSHLEDNVNVNRVRVVGRVRAEATESRENPEIIIGNATLGLANEVRASLHIGNLKRTIQRERIRNQAAPVNPNSLETLVIPDEYRIITKTSAKKTFYYTTRDKKKTAFLFLKQTII